MGKLLREESQDVGYFKQHLPVYAELKMLVIYNSWQKFEQLCEVKESYSVLNYKSHYMDRSEGAIALANESPNKSNYITMTSNPTFYLPSDPHQYKKGKILECLIHHQAFKMY